MTSIWALKKRPLQEVAAYIISNSSAGYQAKMASMPLAEYEQLSEPEAHERIMRHIAQMDDESYTEYLLEIIDE